MTGRSGGDWMKKQQERAKLGFAQHEMKEIGPGHWRLKKPGTGNLWCDIVVMGDVGLAVWGDIEGCFFSYYSGAKDPKELVAWMGRADVSYYGRQKAHIGMNSGELVDEYVDEVALYDLAQALKQREEEYDEEGWVGPCPGVEAPSVKEVYEEAFQEATGAIRRGEHMKNVLDELCHTLMQAGVEDTPYEWVYSIGRVTSCRVIYALAAVARLHELLTAQDAASATEPSPPA